MPLTVILETEGGKKLDELIPTDWTLNRLLPTADTSFPMLGFVDEYADTVFNRNQMRLFLPELDRLIAQKHSEAESELLLRLRALADRCNSHPHLYLRFVGD